MYYIVPEDEPFWENHPETTVGWHFTPTSGWHALAFRQQGGIGTYSLSELSIFNPLSSNQQPNQTKLFQKVKIKNQFRHIKHHIYVSLHKKKKKWRNPNSCHMSNNINIEGYKQNINWKNSWASPNTGRIWFSLKKMARIWLYRNAKKVENIYSWETNIKLTSCKHNKISSIKNYTEKEHLPEFLLSKEKLGITSAKC